MNKSMLVAAPALLVAAISANSVASKPVQFVPRGEEMVPVAVQGDGPVACLTNYGGAPQSLDTVHVNSGAQA